ncbi:MAG: LacI family DNA-binding transcriptional regulator [Microvirga sp.]
MADVARHANVSTASVSYFLSGDNLRLKRVGTDARLRILTAIAALNYVQNGAARQLRKRRAERICLILPRLGVPYSDRIAQDVQGAMKLRGLSTIIAAGPDYPSVERIFLEIEGGLADGVIAELQHLTAEEVETLTRRLAVSRKPMIIFHPTAKPNGFCVFRQDAAKAIGEALHSLYKAGHRRIAYMRHAQLGERTRVEAYLSFLGNTRLPLDETIMFDGAESRATAHEAALALLRLGNRPTALLTESDIAAITALNTFQAAGLKIPDDIAVIGCGNIDEGQFSLPRLSTIGPEFARFSHLADHVADLIAGKRVSRSKVFELPWSVIRRNSA